MACDREGGERVSTPRTVVCPVNGKPYHPVSRRTVLHQIRKSWRRPVAQQAFYFCSDPQCDVVYFAQDATVITRDEIRQDVGQKSRDGQRTVCYCFDISMADIEAARKENDGDACREFVIQQTKASTCDCETRNPSGKCCLGDFPKSQSV